MTTSGPAQGAPPKRRHRRFWQAVAVLAVAAVVLGVFALSQGDDDGDGGGPLNAIAAAAERTQSEPGGRATMRMVMTAPDQSESLTMTGTAAYDDGMERSRMTMRFRDPDSGELIEMEMVTEGAMMYMRSDLFEGELPNEANWMAIDLADVTGMEMPLPTESDPKGELETLEEATGVEKLGKETVRGVQTTRYGGFVSVSDQVTSAREQGADDLASELEEEGAPLRLEVWIDAKGLARRARILATEPAQDGEGETTVDMRMDFFDFGFTPEIELPGAGEVFDATALAEAGVDS
jgi:hypothetical protein